MRVDASGAAFRVALLATLMLGACGTESPAPSRGIGGEGAQAGAGTAGSSAGVGGASGASTGGTQSSSAGTASSGSAGAASGGSSGSNGGSAGALGGQSGSGGSGAASAGSDASGAGTNGAGAGGGPSGGAGSGGSSGSGGAGGDAAGAGAAGAAPLSFARDVWPVFDQLRDPVFVYRGRGSYDSCTTPVCHGGENPGGDLYMPDAQTAYEQLLDVPAVTTLCGDTTRVIPGNPDDSCLILFYIGRLKDDLQWVGEAEVDLVRRWIAEGALP